jgi:hypothetical protein
MVNRIFKKRLFLFLVKNNKASTRSSITTTIVVVVVLATSLWNRVSEIALDCWMDSRERERERVHTAVEPCITRWVAHYYFPQIEIIENVKRKFEKCRARPRRTKLDLFGSHFLAVADPKIAL